MLLKLRQLEEEDPELHIVWNEELGEIHAAVDGGSTDRDFTKYDPGNDFRQRSRLDREILYIRRQSNVRRKVSGILSRCAIMRKYICF